MWITSGSELEPLNGTFVDHVPKDTVIVIYGDMGKSTQLPLVAEEDDTSSSPGNTQYFKVIDYNNTDCPTFHNGSHK